MPIMVLGIAIPPRRMRPITSPTANIISTAAMLPRMDHGITIAVLAITLGLPILYPPHQVLHQHLIPLLAVTGAAIAKLYWLLAHIAAYYPSKQVLGLFSIHSTTH